MAHSNNPPFHSPTTVVTALPEQHHPRGSAGGSTVGRLLLSPKRDKHAFSNYRKRITLPVPIASGMSLSHSVTLAPRGGPKASSTFRGPRRFAGCSWSCLDRDTRCPQGTSRKQHLKPSLRRANDHNKPSTPLRLREGARLRREKGLTEIKLRCRVNNFS